MADTKYDLPAWRPNASFARWFRRGVGRTMMDTNNFNRNEVSVMKLQHLAIVTLAAAFATTACIAETEPVDDDDDDGSDASSTSDPGNGPGNGPGNESPDNVAACNTWVSTVQCGTVDVSMYVDCNQYSAMTCDISGYFDCLSSNTGCNGGALDTTGWANCAQQATCM